jgi:Protein of unknown function (DUF3592)
MKNSRVIVGIIGIVLLCCGGIGAIGAIWAINNTRNISQNDEQAIAVVTGNEEHHTQSNFYYCAEFQFQTKEGQTISFKQDDSTNVPCSGAASASPDYKIGQQVPVYYDPHDPAHTAQLVAWVKNEYITALVIGVPILIVAILCIIGGLVLFVKGLAKSRRDATANTP